MFVFIQAIVQEKYADSKFRKTSEIGGERELELKIQKIDFFSDIKDKFVNNLKINIPLQLLSEDVVVMLNKIILGNKGNVNVYIQVHDQNSFNKINFFARQHRIDINPKVYRTLKAAKTEGILDFDIN
jgi:hypothetical protein